MSFQQGLSGLNAASKNLEVIGNNVANANTYGGKTSRAEFADMYASALNGSGNSDVGIGVQVAAIAQQFTQGNISPTGNPLDLAINGNGFFQVQDSALQTDYTRNGQFKLDRNGFIVNDQGSKLLGYAADGQGNILAGKASPLQLPTQGIAPNASTQVDMAMNLSSSEPVLGNASAVPPVAVPTLSATDKTTYSYSTSATVYDAKGQDVAVTYYFQHTSANDWSVFAQANGQWLGSGTATTPAPVGTMTFNGTGSALTAPADGKITMDLPATTSTTTGAAVLPITGLILNVTGATSVAAKASAVTNLSQDGYSSGDLVGVAVDDSGQLMARYSNGQSKAAGQVELAEFRNPQGLQSMGGNAWRRTFQSGDAVLGTPGNGNMGAMQSGALEESNVDLTAELVSMITAQRDYQANAQTIKTMDQAMQTLVNLR
jgi:flagellar hook protein FlgE